MNYPVWQVAFGSGWLIAVVATLHVFVSHFAIGGGLFLVLLEGSAHRHDDEALRAWLKRHSRFFLLLTLVFGALTGVGIWFTIGLISPEATGRLIRIFVWGWAIEWVFFLVEILAILVYYYAWDRMETLTHRAVGWTYFGAAWASLAVINGILAFQLSPGAWLQDRSLLSAFFNPTYFSSLAVRTLVCLALAGLYALASLAFTRNGLRPDLVKKSAVWVAAPVLLLPAAAWWYLRTVPALQKTALTEVFYLPHLARTVMVSVSLLFLLAAVAWFSRSKWILRPLSVLMLLLGFAALAFSEWTREDLRMPFLIAGDTYINQVPVARLAELRAKGILATSPWVSAAAVTPQNQRRVGEELFRLACSHCHTVRKGLIPLAPKMVAVDETFAANLALRTDQMRGRMPPFPGTAEEARAIAHYLRLSAMPVPQPGDGASVFRRRCGPCHTVSGAFRPLAKSLKGMAESELSDLVQNLDSMNDKMPPWTGTNAERGALCAWLAGQVKASPVGGAP